MYCIKKRRYVNVRRERGTKEIEYEQEGGCAVVRHYSGEVRIDDDGVISVLAPSWWYTYTLLFKKIYIIENFSGGHHDASI